jgi:hypothetical protein
MNFGQNLSVLMSVLLIGGGFPAAAQDKPATTSVATKVTIEKDTVRDTYVASFQEENGSGKAWIVKDPNSLEVQGSHVKGETWTGVIHLGQSPWGKPGTLDEIRKDPKVRQNIKTMTTLNSQQQSALNKGLDSSEGWVTVKASELPILEAFWGNGWQKYKVLMELETKFGDTEVYLYFSPDVKEWFAFYSYCRNLGQPFVSYVWQEQVTENAVPPKPFVPVVVEPKCSSLNSADGSSAPLVGADRRIYVAEFSNPSGLELAVSYKLIEKKNDRVIPLSSGDPKIEINATWLDVGKYELRVDALYNGKHINTDRCVAEFAVALPPPPPPALSVKVDQPPKKGHGWVWLVLVGGAAAGAAAAFAGKGGSGVYKTPQTVPGGRP